MILNNIVLINTKSDLNIFFVHILIAFILSFFIGSERQFRRRSIGLRMTVLVCIGSLIFTHASLTLINADVGRIAASVVSGIGFLGAGIIIQDEHKNITGLNTAATVWASAGIGMLCAMGLLFEAVIGTVFILISNISLRNVALKLSKIEPTKNGYNMYSIKVSCKTKNMTNVRNDLVNFAESEHICVDNVEVIEKKDSLCTIVVKVRIPYKKLDFIEHMMNTLTLNENIISLGWMKLEEE